MTAATVVVLLTLLLGIQPVTTDLYLPALPTLQRALGISIAAAQLTCINPCGQAGKVGPSPRLSAVFETQLA